MLSVKKLIPPGGWMEIGTIVAPQGLKGEVRVYPHSDFPERFEVAGERWLYSNNQAEPESVQLQRGYGMPGKEMYVVKLQAIDTREQAESLRGKMLLVPADDRLALQAGEYHVADLIDLPVFLQATGEQVGIVVDLVSLGHDLLVVKTPAKEIWIPFVPEIVPVVNMEQRRIEITPPDGLLALNNS
jgi:16S rRNA processing protein RimM